MSARYAVYFAPEKLSPWWMFGAHWLGRDEYESVSLPQPKLDDVSQDELALVTAQPRRYGFHATLKAPFRLAEGFDEVALLLRLEALAKTLAPVPLGAVQPKTLSDFVALVPNQVPACLAELAASCVLGLDDLRAPLSPDDLLKREAHKLDARGAELLTLYGYPQVMERFRLHLTLTGPVDTDMANRIERAAATTVAHLNEAAPLTVDRLCLFVEKTPGAPFLRIADYLLGGIAR